MAWSERMSLEVKGLFASFQDGQEEAVEHAFYWANEVRKAQNRAAQAKRLANSSALRAHRSKVAVQWGKDNRERKRANNARADHKRRMAYLAAGLTVEGKPRKRRYCGSRYSLPAIPVTVAEGRFSVPGGKE